MRKPGISRTPEIDAEILARLTEGETLRQICRDDHMPSDGAFLNWLRDDGDLEKRYARARSVGLDVLADELLDVANDQSILPDSRRVMVEARKWLLSRLKPAKYGDKIQAEHSGGLSITVSRVEAPE
jgi:hypothetical protein